MSKEEAIRSLENIEVSLSELQTLMNKLKGSVISGRSLRERARKIAIVWFEEVENTLVRFNVAETTKSKYHNFFDKLLRLSLKISRKNTYLKIIEEILKDFKEELILPVMKAAGKIVYVSHLTKILENVSEDEKEYLTEAINCAAHGFLRASIVLGWNAAVHRMHKVIEKLGFGEFNRKSEEMKKITDGRFKRFSKSFSVHSISELRATVFDNDLLWILEYWGLIDSNQHDRLSICLTMRNNCAHPGEAPLTEENLASFYSDLKEIIFDNPNFKI